MFAEAFARTLPLVFGPLIIQQWTADGAWAEASRNWGLVCRCDDVQVSVDSNANPLNHFDTARTQLGSLLGQNSESLRFVVGCGSANCKHLSSIVILCELRKPSLTKQEHRILLLVSAIIFSQRALPDVSDTNPFACAGLLGLALSILAVGGCRSVLVLGAARASSGFFAGALVSR
jgi:hypothetical protein